MIFAKPSAHQRTFRDRLIDLITVRKHKETTLASGHDMCHRYRSDLRKVGKLVHYSKPGYDHPLGWREIIWSTTWCILHVSSPSLCVSPCVTNFQVTEILKWYDFEEYKIPLTCRKLAVSNYCRIHESTSPCCTWAINCTLTFALKTLLFTRSTDERNRHATDEEASKHLAIAGV